MSDITVHRSLDRLEVPAPLCRFEGDAVRWLVRIAAHLLFPLPEATFPVGALGLREVDREQRLGQHSNDLTELPILAALIVETVSASLIAFLV